MSKHLAFQQIRIPLLVLQGRFLIVRTFLILLVINCPLHYFTGTAQVVDDSTKNIFGTKTTQYITEEDLRYGISTKHPADTSLQGIHDYNFVQKAEMTSQHLGNLGTAYYPLYFSIDSSSTPDAGFNNFNAYYTNPKKRKYFDSKSPYADLFYMIGTKDEQIFSATFARNITRTWNMGAEYKRMASDKKIGSTALHDNQLDFKGLDLFSWFHSPGYRYHLLVLFSYTDHKIKETGGVFQDTTISKDEFFDGDIEGVNLYTAQTHHYRREWQIYQFYDFGRRTSDTLSDWEVDDRNTIDFYSNRKWLKDSATYNTPEKKDSICKIYKKYFSDSLHFVKSNRERLRPKKFRFYNRFKGNQRTYKFTDDAPEPAFYSAFTDSLFSFALYENIRWNFLEQTVGFALPGNNKTDSNHCFHADFYLKSQQYNSSNENGTLTSPTSSLVTGFYSILNTRNWKFTIDGWHFLKSYDEGKNYIKTSAGLHDFLFRFIQNKNFGNELQKEYQGDFIQWKNIFNSMTTRQLEAGYQWIPKNKAWKIYPVIGKIMIENLIYYDTQSKPIQTLSTHSFFYFNLRFNFYPSHFGFENYFQQNFLSDTGLIRLPGFYIFNRLYYENTVFGRKMPMQTGFDLRTTDSWNAYSYNPVIQQFYLQNKFPMRAYTSVDFFLNFRIGDALVFFKITHLNQGIVTKGYFASPWYPAYPRTMQLGVNWRFFD